MASVPAVKEDGRIVNLGPNQYPGFYYVRTGSSLEIFLGGIPAQKQSVQCFLLRSLLKDKVKDFLGRIFSS